MMLLAIQPAYKPRTVVGAIVLDVGCGFSQRAILDGRDRAAFVVIVAMFDWGLRVRDNAGEVYDCSMWIAVP